MVARPHRGRTKRRRDGFALAELMISTAIFTVISAGLLMAFISLKRNYVATTDFAINHAAQMRISDYMAMDFRRALSVDPPTQNNLSLYIPCYYDTNQLPQSPNLDGTGGVYYGASGCSIPVHYYLSGGSIYRQEGTANPVALVVNVQNFNFNTTDLGKVVNTTITFMPNFRNVAAEQQIVTATSFYNTTLLRNNRGVY